MRMFPWGEDVFRNQKLVILSEAKDLGSWFF